MGAQRTGVPSIQKTALRLCNFISRYSAIIATVSGNDPAVAAALAAALAACQTLHQTLEPYRVYGD